MLGGQRAIRAGGHAGGGSAVTPRAGSSVPVPPPDPVPGAGVKVTLADVGLEASSLDRTADPCVDFYQFACGGWLAASPIPADRSRWARFSEIDDKNRGALKTLLEEGTRGLTSDPAMKKLGDYYASCMDEDTIEKTGLGAVKPLLDRVAKVKDARSWQAALTELHKLGEWVVFQPLVPDYKRSRVNVVRCVPRGWGYPIASTTCAPSSRTSSPRTRCTSASCSRSRARRRQRQTPRRSR